MPSNWPSWAKRYLGSSKAKPTPANQEKVARGKFKTLYRWLKSWRRVAYWWLTGSSRKTGWSAYANRYVRKVMNAYAKASRPDPDAGRARASRLHRYSERSSAVDYTGRWTSARHGAYAGDAVRYSKSGWCDRDHPVHRASGSSGTARSARPVARPRSGSMVST